MWNEILNKIDAAETPLLAIEQWGGQPDSLRLINEGINLVYRFECQQQGYYLRMTHSSLRKEETLLAAILYQSHLYNHQAPVCEPIVSKQGRWIESILQGQELFLAHVCKEVPGQHVNFSYSQVALYEQWGKALGALHKAAQLFDTGHHHYVNWSESFDEMSEYVKKESREIQDVFISVRDYFNQRQQTSYNFGLTHGDHREANVITDGQQVHIIDFDLPSKNWFMEDVARPFFYPLMHDQTNWRDKIKPYLDGYFSIMPKSSIDLSALPKQIQMKGLEIYLWTKNNWSGELAPGGENTAKWLDCIYQKLINSNWIEQLPR
ncbi:MAG: phosphotransferase [Legionellaceae bacterium]|nr:phosphotransferase [Legionellaceae bacterium]